MIKLLSVITLLGLSDVMAIGDDKDDKGDAQDEAGHQVKFRRRQGSGRMGVCG